MNAMVETKECPVIEYRPTDAALAELRTKYAGAVFVTNTTKGMEAAKEARAELRGYRVALEKKRVDIKAPALERCRLIDSEAKRITAVLEELETPIDQAIKAEEQRKEIEKAEKAQLEAERVAALNARFDAIKDLPRLAVGKSVDFIRAKLQEADSLDPETFPEDVRAAAVFEKRNAVAGLRAALDAREAADAEAEKIAAERAELAALRAKIEADAKASADAEAAIVAGEQRKRDEAERIERDRLAAEFAAKRQANEEAEASRRAELAAEADRQAKERAKLEADKKAITKKARAAEIASATIYTAAAEAVTFLQAEGYGDHLVTQKLEAAVRRQPTA